jgi:hypothetical protein
LIKAHYVFPSNHEEHGKRATILIIGRALQRFRDAFNKFYVQPGVSPFNRFGFITPNEWNTFQQQHTTPEAMARSNRMKELIQKNSSSIDYDLVGTRLQYHSEQRRNKSFVRLGYRITLKVAHCTQETGSEVGLV